MEHLTINEVSWKPVSKTDWAETEHPKKDVYFREGWEGFTILKDILVKRNATILK